ncbi:MAG: hypothetical protein D6692_12535 [Planctomycetota bacterium]|nr:MAG: hypothetical protein D6692_12535 [Planctomycetota bacterium]
MAATAEQSEHQPWDTDYHPAPSTPSAPSLDLRRARDPSLSTTIAERARWLNEPQRTLVLAVFRDGIPAADLARLHGLPPRAVRRTVTRAAIRLLNPMAPFVARHAPDWTPTRARVARSIYIQGRSMRATADHAGLSLHAVRIHRDAIEGMFDELQHQRTRAGIDRTWR